MSRNEGNLDRVLRALLGAVLIALPALGLLTAAQPVLFWGALIAGAIMLVTAATGFCPIYRIAGLKTCEDC